MWEAWVWCLGWRVYLKKEMETPSSTVAWRIQWTRGDWGATVYSQRAGQDWVTNNFTFTFASIRVISNESDLCIRWPKYWSFSFKISPCKEYSELISFRIYWFDSLAVQGTLKSLLQHHYSKVSVLQCSAFLLVHLSHLCMPTGKTKALTIGTFFGKVMPLLFNVLSVCHSFSFQGANIFEFHGYSHHLQ